MKLIFERKQETAGMLGHKQRFSVRFRAEISKQENDAIHKYRLSNEVLYQSHDVTGGSGVVGVVSRAYLRSQVKSLSVRDLVNGKTIACDDLGEMLDVEGQVLEAAKNLKTYLEIAVTFGGRQVIEI